MAKVYGPPLSYSGYTKSEILNWKKNGSHESASEEKEETGIDIPPSYIDDPMADVYGPPTPIDNDPFATIEEKEETDINILRSYIDEPIPVLYGPPTDYYDQPPVTPQNDDDDNKPIDIDTIFNTKI